MAHASEVHVDPTERFSFVSHALGALVAVAGLVVLIVRADRPVEVVSAAIYGATLVLLLGASALHHAVHPRTERGRRALRLLDHIAIYLLIAGTYTPVTLAGFGGAWGWAIFGVIWGLAAGGTVLKLLWRDAPRWVSTAMYIAMGWTVLAAIPPLVRAFPAEAVVLLFASGVVYSAGAVVYAAKRPDPMPRWLGFHGVWHVAVLVAAAMQFALVYGYVL